MQEKSITAENTNAEERNSESSQNTNHREEKSIPTKIFTDRNVAVLEAVVEYLKDAQFMPHHEIAKALHRDERTIWTAYNRAKKKHTALSPRARESESIPLKALADRKYSIFEAAVKYLKEEKKLKYVKIAKLTARNERTIWTVYSRAKKKERGGAND